MSGGGPFPWQPKQPWYPPMVAPQRVDVSPEMVDGAAKNFAVGQRDLIDTWMRLLAGLDAAHGMAGNDKAAGVFNAAYAPAVGTAWKAFGQAVVVIGGTSLGLTQTGNNHLTADHRSRADASGGAPALLGPNEVYPDMSLAAPQSAIGPAATGPYFGANRVLATLLAGYWPAAHPNNLEDAAGKWHAAAGEVDKVAGWLNWSIGQLADSSQTRDVAAIQRYWRKVYQAGDGHSLLGGLSKLCNALGDACDRYASVTWSTQNKINLIVSSQEVLIALTAGIEGVLAKLSATFERIAAAGVAAVGREVGAAITEDVVAEVESAAAGTPKIEPIEANFEATAGRAIEHELTSEGLAARADNLEGLRDYVVDDPADPGRTITDVDHKTLWEEKSAMTAGDINKWVAKHIDKKFGSYLDARQYMPGYEQAPIGFRFTRAGATPEFRGAVEDAVNRLRASHPDVTIRLEWS